MTVAKEIIFEEEARELLLAGIKELADVVGFTLGPRGRNVGLEKSWGAPTITNDGSSIVKDITLKDSRKNMGVAMATEIVQKLKEKCGDGTTTVILLLRALVENGVKQIASGASPIGVKRGLDKAVEAVIQELEKISIPVNDQKDIRHIAIASASGDQEIGEMIAKAIETVGTAGVVTIEKAKGTETTLKIEEGMQFDRGYASHHFCTNADKMIVEMQNPMILIVDRKLSNIHELLPILQTTAASGKPLVIIAEDFEGDVLATLVVNKRRGTLKVVAVKAPGFGDNRKAMLQDIAVLTGGKVVSEDTGISLKEIDPSLLGSAEQIVSNKENTIIVNGAGKKEAVQARVKEIETEINHAKNSYDKEKFAGRKAKLSGGVAVISVGGATEPEQNQKKQCYEDSLNSTKAALEEGIVPGGGVALLRASQAIARLKLEGDEAVGGRIVEYACEYPLKQIVWNAGLDGSVMLAEVKQAKTNEGFNVLSEKIEDLVKAGVIDALKVLRLALTLAASAAGIVLISEVLILDAEEEA